MIEDSDSLPNPGPVNFIFLWQSEVSTVQSITMKTFNHATRSAAVLLIVGFLIVCVGRGASGTNRADNITIIRTFYEEGWNKANLGIVDKLWDERGVLRTSGDTVTGREAMKERMRDVFAAMPDLRLTIDDIVADGDKVIVRWTAIGTHRGSWKGIQPTNRQIKWSGLEWDRFDGGMIRDMQREYDTAGFMRQLDVPETGFAPVRGGRLYYEIAGSGDPLVFVHGNEGDCRHWDAQFEDFAKEFRVVRYDVRGFGRSSHPAEGEAYADYADLAQLLDHLHIKTAHVAGWSMGSGIAVDFAVAHPERTRSLIPVGPWVNGQSSAATTALTENMIKVGEIFARDGHAAALSAFMATVLGATVRDAAVGEEFRRIAGGYSFCRQSGNFPQPLTPSAVGRLAEIRVPTLIMTAEHDVPACREAATLLRTSVPGAREVVMPGTGHLLHMERPAEFNRHVIRFLRETAKPRR